MDGGRAGVCDRASMEKTAGALSGARDSRTDAAGLGLSGPWRLSRMDRRLVGAVTVEGVGLGVPVVLSMNAEVLPPLKLMTAGSGTR